MNFKCGLNLGAAREKVRVAHALETLPHIAAAMARGELSYSKVRALSRVACAATEENLLMIALHGTAHHVETIVRHYRRAQQVIRPAATAYDWTDLQTANEAQGIRIDSGTAATRWRGERIDYELGVWGLCHQAERARNVSASHLDVSAETSE